MLALLPAYAPILMPFGRRYNLALGVGLATTVVLAWVAGRRLGAGIDYPLMCAAFFAVLTTAVERAAGGDHPHQRFGPANWVTMTRAALASLAAGLIGRPAAADVLWSVVALAALIAALDGIDGRLARSTGMTSAYGARFDMETDAALILVLSILVWQHGKAGPWVLLCGLMRYGFVAAGWVLPWLARPLRATRRGRAVAVAQFAGLAVALAPAVPPGASALVAAVALAALAWSFAIDILWLAQQYRSGLRSSPGTP